MVIRKPPIREMQMDLIGLGLLLAVAVGGYVLFLHGPLADAWVKKKVCSKREEIVRHVDELKSQSLKRRQEMRDLETDLVRLNNELRAPVGIDELIKRLDDLARQCNLEIARWQPRGTEPHAEYEVHIFQVQGNSTFLGLYRWLALIESGVPLLDVTHFAIRVNRAPELGEAETQDDPRNCEFECTLKMYRGWRGDAVEMAAAKP